MERVIKSLNRVKNLPLFWASLEKHLGLVSLNCKLPERSSVYDSRSRQTQGMFPYIFCERPLINGIGQPRDGFCTLEESAVTSGRTVETGYLTPCPKSHPALNTARGQSQGWGLWEEGGWQTHFLLQKGTGQVPSMLCYSAGEAHSSKVLLDLFLKE